MIYVQATVLIQKDFLAQALECYRRLVPKILAEEAGCIEYTPTVDIDFGLGNQQRAATRILVAERWRSEEDFRAHLGMPHCVEFRAQIRPFLASEITITATQPALTFL